ncbi:hypothetical protein [Cohnella fermenti]|uniref:hypothetical protein n=1 Tax=Cohnella fermenti TaxID=2565925 RepID=UPI001E5A2B43|nr:hypothetical protein [Cohnella fermenti]
MSPASTAHKLASAPESSSELSPRRSPKKRLWPFFLLWVVLIGAGVYGTYSYTEQQQEQLTLELQQQTDRQLEAMRQSYEQRLDELEANYTEQMAQLESKVEALNELLTFNQDNVNDKTDSSNKLYTQISELKKQIDELKKNLDVLK